MDYNKNMELSELDSFAIYRLPEGENSILIHQKGQAKKLVEEDYSTDGFVFHPFDKNQAESYFIQTEKRIVNPRWSFTINIRNKSTSTTKESYIDKINTAINNISNDMSKVVMSRVLIVKRKKKSLNELYNQMCLKYPNAFCYLVHIPTIGCWMGATPEQLLIETTRNEFTSMSLAGTHKITKESVIWSPKELEEQLIVTKYLRTTFLSLNINYKERELTTLQNGFVEHLCTTFDFKSNNIVEVIQQFHPTPAVCGMPKINAKEYILNNDGYNRKYYTGYLGPTGQYGLLKLYVNLRCMEVFQANAKLYLGGGITLGSNAEAEWDETSWKAKTMLQLFD